MVRALRERVDRAIRDHLRPHEPALQALWRSYEALLSARDYVAHADLKDWAYVHRARFRDAARAIFRLFGRDGPVGDWPPEDPVARARHLNAALQTDRRVLVDRNRAFVQREMAACRDFFDTVESTPLTPEQREACVVMEDRNLLVASAGSGKTSTVVGKVGYALLRRIVAPDEVLIVAFNAHAAREIEARVRERLKRWLDGPGAITVRTFHALGLEIISRVEGRRPSVMARSEDGGMTADLIQDLLDTDGTFRQDWVSFNALYPDEALDPASCETPEDWQAFLRTSGEYRNGEHGLPTLAGDLAASPAERAVANWLLLHGVAYEHRPVSEYRPVTGRRRAYRPSFHLPGCNLYLVHVVRRADGGPAPAFREAEADYRSWARRVTRAGTVVVEIRHVDYADGTLFEELRKVLKRKGVAFRRMSEGDAVERLRTACPQQLDGVRDLLQTFTRHARSGDFSSERLEAAAGAHKESERARLFVRLASSLMRVYAQRLRDRREVDFEDMVLRAARYAREGRYRHGFRLILVDEFQDISKARAELVLGLLKRAPRCRLFAVGDDWQSIYRFAGSDISLFTGFGRHFGTTETRYLTRTFRSNRGIAEAAAAFVQRNPAQIGKTVVAGDETQAATLVVRRYGSRRDAPRYVAACLEEIAEQATGAGETATVFLMGRYRRQAPRQLGEWQERYDGVLTITYRTMHGSKGLQADCVILVGLEAGAFPCERTDDSLLQMVMPEPERHPHAEERRLFYVALTRARHRVYLIGSRRSPSAFLTELVADTPSAVHAIHIADDLVEKRVGATAAACPKCGAGRLALKQGRNGAFFGCTAYPACRYTHRAEV